uniref:Uncharacterized protein n=1 Tax=Rhizophagus irregularis (strain DAOM 181602 / DAOM 197198 / MUCL 43194) TaxID=747089 RepID=U9UWF9_RHIID
MFSYVYRTNSRLNIEEWLHKISDVPFNNIVKRESIGNFNQQASDNPPPYSKYFLSSLTIYAPDFS